MAAVGFPDGWEEVEAIEEVAIPNRDGTGITEVVKVTVTAYRNPRDGEIYLDGHALAKLDRVRANRMRLMWPEAAANHRQRGEAPRSR